MAEKTRPQDWKSGVVPDWCPGCGDHGVLGSLQKACSGLGLARKDVLVVSGIGCSSNLPGFFRSYGFHSLHGRAVPVATGAKLANPALTVVVTGGDGDGYGIGLGHFLHAARRNLDLTYIVMDNQVYGLTTGQASSTTALGVKTKSTPEGVIERPINPLLLALSAGATFVARAYSMETGHMVETFMAAIRHKGFSLVDCFSPCVTWNRLNTYEWFKSRVAKLDAASHDRTYLAAAMRKAAEEDPFPLGVFYARTDLPTYEELDPTIRTHGSVAGLPLGLSPQEQEELLAGFL